MNNILVYICLAFMICCAYLGFRVSILEKEAEQGKEFEGLYKNSMQEAKVWKDKHEQWHSLAMDMYVSNSTLKQMLAAKDPDITRLLSEVSDLKKNLSNLQSFNTSATHSETRFNVQLKDTTIGTGGKAKMFSYKTRWDEFKGVLYNDSVFMVRQGVDTLDIAMYWRRKWLLGKKTYSTEVVSANPDTKITYNRSVSIKRKRR